MERSKRTILKQQTKSITKIFYDLKIFWEELDLYLPLPMRTYRIKCSCEAMRSARSNHQLLHYIHCWTRLNDQFIVVKSHIFLMDPLPPLNKKILWLFKRQNQLHIPTDESQSLINVVDFKSFGSKLIQTNKVLVCAHLLNFHLTEQKLKV